MYISARSDYAMQAMLVIAAESATGKPVQAATLAARQQIPYSFLQGTLVALRHAGLLISHRGTRGGYTLARPAAAISVGDVLRAVSGDLIIRRGQPGEEAYFGAAAGLRGFWPTVNAAASEILDSTTLADLHPHELNAAAGIAS